MLHYTTLHYTTCILCYMCTKISLRNAAFRSLRKRGEMDIICQFGYCNLFIITWVVAFLSEFRVNEQPDFYPCFCRQKQDALGK